MNIKIKQKKNTGKKRYPSKNGEVLKKADITRGRILAAARKVFARHSYHAASIRMIGAEGGFDHGIIRYHFASKAILFESLVKMICDEYYEGNVAWSSGLEKMSPAKGLSLYLDRFLDYNFKNPEVILILAQNLAQADQHELIPGHQMLTDMLTTAKRSFEESIPLRASSEEISMFLDSFNALVFTFIGAKSYLAKISGISPSGKKYRNYVKDTMMFVLLPALTHLIFPESTE